MSKHGSPPKNSSEGWGQPHYDQRIPQPLKPQREPRNRVVRARPSQGPVKRFFLRIAWFFRTMGLERGVLIIGALIALINAGTTYSRYQNTEIDARWDTAYGGDGYISAVQQAGLYSQAVAEILQGLIIVVAATLIAWLVVRTWKMMKREGL